MNFKKTVLDNGVRIITYPMENTHALTLLVLFGTGSRYETKDINGISHLLEHMVFKGTTKRPGALDIAKELDKVGGIMNAFTGKEYMGFWIKIDSKHLNLACDILSDMVLNARLLEEEIEKEKKVIFEEINMIKDMPQRYIGDLFEKLLYGDQPAGWSIAGEKETVGSIKRADVLNYRQKHFTARNAIVCLSGNFENNEAIAKISGFFSNFAEAPVQDRIAIQEIQKKPEVLLNYKETDQSHFCLGVRAFDIFSPKKYALEVASVILGGNMSSRLFSEIREKRGLAYHISTSNELYTDSGFLLSQAGTDNKRIEEAIEVTLNEYRKISLEKADEEELKKAKDNIKGHLDLYLETSDAWNTYLGMQEVLTKKILTPEEECAMIDKVTSDDVLNVAKEIFMPEKLNLSLIGPFKDEEKFRGLLSKF